MCLILEESTLSVVEFSGPGIGQKREEWACPGCKGQGLAVEGRDLDVEGGAWSWRVRPGRGGRSLPVEGGTLAVEGGAWLWRAGPGCGRQARAAAPHPHFPHFLARAGSGGARRRRRAGPASAERWPGEQFPRAAALSGGRGEYRPRLARLWAAAGSLRRALRDGTQPGAVVH